LITRKNVLELLREIDIMWCFRKTQVSEVRNNPRRLERIRVRRIKLLKNRRKYKIMELPASDEKNEKRKRDLEAISVSIGCHSVALFRVALCKQIALNLSETHNIKPMRIFEQVTAAITIKDTINIMKMEGVYDCRFENVKLPKSLPGFISAYLSLKLVDGNTVLEFPKKLDRVELPPRDSKE